MIGFIDTLYTSLGTTGNYSAIADLHTSQFTITYSLGFSVFASRILETDLQQSHCHFKSYINISFHKLFLFLPLFCNCRLNSIPLFPNSYLGRLASRNSTQFYAAPLSFGTFLYNNFAWTTQKTQPLYC
jgi:hypothetical protein